MKPETRHRYPQMQGLAASVRGAPLDVAHPAFMAHFGNTLHVESSLYLSGRKFLLLLIIKAGVLEHKW